MSQVSCDMNFGKIAHRFHRLRFAQYQGNKSQGLQFAEQTQNFRSKRGNRELLKQNAINGAPYVNDEIRLFELKYLKPERDEDAVRRPVKVVIDQPVSEKPKRVNALTAEMALISAQVKRKQQLAETGYEE